jgi:hypothetical protein
MAIKIDPPYDLMNLLNSLDGRGIIVTDEEEIVQALLEDEVPRYLTPSKLFTATDYADALEPDFPEEHHPDGYRDSDL